MDFNLQTLTDRLPYRPEPAAEWLEDAKNVEAFFTYTDRASYLEWVIDWKAAYKDLSLRQRETKAKIKPLGYANAAPGDLYDKTEQRRQARAMLALRRHAKADSWAKRSAAKEAASAA